jgi:hypothetical protein
MTSEKQKLVKDPIKHSMHSKQKHAYIFHQVCYNGINLALYLQGTEFGYSNRIFWNSLVFSG